MTHRHATRHRILRETRRGGLAAALRQSAVIVRLEATAISQLRRPCMDNAAAEIDRHDPHRRKLVERLHRVEVRMPESARNASIGDSATISVPCRVLDLL